MYLNILKKDLKRKKAMNIIVLVFIILATMFVSSSVNNIYSVTSALDNYLEMADAPDYLTLTMNKSSDADVEEVLLSAESVESFGKEEIMYLSPSNMVFEDEKTQAPSGTTLLQNGANLSMNYFLEDNSVLNEVSQGEIYITAHVIETLGLKSGEKITIEIEGVSREFTLAGGIKDAVLGANTVSITRYIINAEDFEFFSSIENTDTLYGGEIFYINTPNLEKMLSEISDISEQTVFTMNKEDMKFVYIFDMIVTGILLIVSLILIAIAFVVLRFTITFTLSEEYREIGVMKAIGIRDMKIRGLYLIKYLALSVIGAAIGLILSFPFGKMLIDISSKSIIVGNENTSFINILCSLFIIAIILLFCFTCTSKVKKMTPIDAIRSGKTGERFRKKSLMSLGKSKLPTTPFLAVNDIVSSPKRYGIITFTFFLCLTLLLMLSATISTLKSDTIIGTMGVSRSDIVINPSSDIMNFMVEGGHDKVKKHLDEMEEKLEQNGMPAVCVQEYAFIFPVSYGERKEKIQVFQGTGSTMDMYEYTAGTAPQRNGEIAITRIAANKIKANIGDTVSIKTIDGTNDYIITAFFQSMNNQGSAIRLYTDEYINYVQASACFGTQITFTDNPDDKEISRRIEKIKEIYKDNNGIMTCEEWVQSAVAISDTLNAVKNMIAILTIVLAALITILMERSFIANEKGEIALRKAFGTQNGKIYAYYTARFAIVGIIAVVIAEILAMPLTHLCIDPIFKMMGMELAVDYILNPIEMYLVFPLVILVTTTVSAFLTSLYTRKIKSSDTANIE